MVVGDRPGVCGGLDLGRRLVNRRRWKAARQHSWRMVPWKRSTTAMCLGERARIRT